MLGDNHFGKTFFGRILVVVIVAVNKHDDVGVLFDTAGFTQVGHDRAFVGTAFQAAIQLRQGDNRDIQFFRQGF